LIGRRRNPHRGRSLQKKKKRIKKRNPTILSFAKDYNFDKHTQQNKKLFQFANMTAPIDNGSNATQNGAAGLEKKLGEFA
jgi:hypothetical protein